ncbi:MAG: TIGR00725 family protein [Elusimicrobiota bacterium]
MHEKDSGQLSLKDLKVAQVRRKTVGVIGGSKADGETRKIARAVGKEIALCRHTLICGGLGGVMEAACQGAAAAGGLTVGILPGPYAQSANPFVQVPIPTAMSHARNAIIVRSSNILIAIDGRYGTLSEIALAKAIGRRVLGLITWDEVPGVESMGSVEEVADVLKNI